MAVEPTTYADVNVDDEVINHVAPAIGIGNKFNAMSSNEAAMRYTDITSFEQSLHSQRVTDFTNYAAAIKGAFASASPPVTVSNGLIMSIFGSLAHIPVPDGSSNVRIATNPPGD